MLSNINSLTTINFWNGFIIQRQVRPYYNSTLFAPSWEASPHMIHTLDTLPSRKGTFLWVWCEGGVNKV
ncbi:hypothetical protein SAMN04487898_103321 [Pedobacter sp. ok626]|nr:hypothetical protein SAMN04487898_103321 [Pedobacter sp. ok626]